MAYTTKYGNWGGSSDTSKIRSRLFLKYEIVETPTQYKINYYFGFQLEVRVKLSGEDRINLTLTVVDNSSPVKKTEGSFTNVYVNFNKPNTVTRTTSSVRTWTYNKTHSSFTRKFTISTQGLAFSVSFTIPAKPSYTVTYNANGGTGAPKAGTKWYDESLSLSTTKPTFSGYTFDGWYTSASGGTKLTTYTGNSNVTLYAHWKANSYTITYTLAGGSYNGSSTNFTQTAQYKSNFTVTAVPSRSRYTFKGWLWSYNNTLYNPTTESITLPYNVVGNSTLTAVWEANIVSVIFHAYDGPEICFPVYSVDVPVNTIIDLNNTWTDGSFYKDQFAFSGYWSVGNFVYPVRFSDTLENVGIKQLKVEPSNTSYELYPIFKEKQAPKLSYNSSTGYKVNWGSEFQDITVYADNIKKNFVNYEPEEDTQNPSIFGAFRFLKTGEKNLSGLDTDSYHIYITNEDGTEISNSQVNHFVIEDENFVYIVYKFVYDGISIENSYNINLVGTSEL